MIKFYFFLIIATMISCKKEIVKKPVETENTKAKEGKAFKKKSTEEQLIAIKKGTSNDSVLSNDIQFINEIILKGKFKLNITKYEIESTENKCLPIRVDKKTINEFYNEGFKNLGDLNNDKKDDSVFVLHALNICEPGDSYYFSDNNIPRIQTESFCCHPESIFSIGDIDENGGNEIAQYYSSCASSFKTIKIWTLKKGEWKLIDQVVHKINNQYKIFEDFHKLHRKISKGKFKFLEIYDIDGNGKLLKKWKIIDMKQNQ